mgnify:FL=1|jgi:uncharacterized protein (DUF4415 family)
MKNTVKTPKTDLEKVNMLRNDEIDYSDIPEATEEMFKLMTKQEPKKLLVNIRLNEEIIDFFKEHSNKYQTKINEVLLAFVHNYKKAHNQG